MARLKSTLIRQIGIFQFIQFIYKESSDSLKAGFMPASVSFPGSNFFCHTFDKVYIHLLKIRNRAGLLPLPPIDDYSWCPRCFVIFKSPALTLIRCETL